MPSARRARLLLRLRMVGPSRLLGQGARAIAEARPWATPDSRSMSITSFCIVLPVHPNIKDFDIPGRAMQKCIVLA